MDDAQFMSEFGRNPDADMMDSVRGMAVWVWLVCVYSGRVMRVHSADDAVEQRRQVL